MTSSPSGAGSGTCDEAVTLSLKIPPEVKRPARPNRQQAAKEARVTRWDERAWQEATSVDTPEEAAALADERKPRAISVVFPGEWRVIDGVHRFVRSYPNGRRGFWKSAGEFVDV
jgi:hypothetical protein